MKQTVAKPGQSVADQIDERVAEYDDWRGETLAKVRKTILSTSTKITEEWKWSIPVWNYEGIICTGEVYKKVVKLTFAKGASLKDPSGLFNSSLAGKVRRAIDIHEGEKIDTKALKALIKEAMLVNSAGKK